MRRRVLLGVSWLIATIVSTTVAWQAVALVGRQVTGDGRAGGAVVVTAPTLATAPPPSSDTTAGTTADTAATTTGGPAPTEAVAGPTQAFNMVGGSVGVRCEGTSIALQWATPAAGYTVEVRDSGPDEVDVRFESEDRESDFRADCASGVLVAEPDEDD